MARGMQYTLCVTGNCANNLIGNKMKKLIALVVFVLVVIHGVSNAGAKTISTYNLKQAEIVAGV